MKHSPVLTAVRRASRGLGVPCAGETVVAALSGGADSVALVDALATLREEIGFDLVAAHLDHGLREGSAADAQFCSELCERLHVPFRTAAADVRSRARRDGAGVEDAARRERYAFLRSVKDDVGAAAIAVAHTRDDQVETVLLRLLRGSGHTGLAAMRPRSGDVVRPLLEVTRADVLAHLASRALPWREDPTNADPTFLRNRVRHELLPYLEARFNPSLRETLARTAALFAEEADVLAEAGRALYERIAQRDGEGVTIARSDLAAAPRALARLALRQALDAVGGRAQVTADHVEGILDLACAPASSGRRLPLPGGREAIVRFGELRLGRRGAPAAAFAYPLPVPGRVDLPGGLRLSAQPAEGPAVSKEETAIVAADGPLVVRTRRPGDRVRSHGREMSLTRFLMDRRVPADLRGGLPLVAAGGQVLWMPGQPVDGGSCATRFVCLSVERAS